MSHYLITGGTGFIGSTLVKRLIEDGHRITILSRHPSRHQSRFDRSHTTRVSQLDNIDSETAIDADATERGHGPVFMVREQLGGIKITESPGWRIR